MNFNLTLLGQAISLAIFVGICMKYIWPHVINALREREKKVADGLAAADEGQKKLLAAESRSVELLDEGKQQAMQIVGQAEKRRDEIVEEAKQTARDEGRRLIEAAQGEIEQEKERAREALRQQVAALALAGAEQILRHEVDRNTHNEMLGKLSSSL